MTSFHKIFFVGMVVLSVAVGSNFNGADDNSGNNPSLVISASAEKTFAKNSAPEGVVQSMPLNDSTTQNDIRVPASPDVNPETDQETVFDNSVLLKLDSFSAKSAFYRIGSDEPPVIGAQAALIADLVSGQSYFEFNPTLRWPTASITKLMTAVAVLKNADLTKPLTMGESGISTGDDPTHLGALSSGGSFSGNDVLTSMFLVSQNEAAETLARTYGRESFIKTLNETAAELGMDSTHFSDPSGLSVANQSTASDLQKLALKIYQDYPKIFEITRKKTATVTELNSRKKIKLSNINAFAGTSGFIGGKTGETAAASGNLLSVFSYGGRLVLVIVLGTEDRFGETEKLLAWFENNFKLNR